MIIKQLRFVFLLVLGFYSCNYFSFERKKGVQELDTVVDQTTLDVFPSFAMCDSIISKEQKTDCFRQTLHREIASKLGRDTILVKKPVEETIEVSIVVFANDRVELKSITVSEELIDQIPDLRARIEKSIQLLPKVRAAIKRGIPVTSQYKLPIRMRLRE